MNTLFYPLSYQQKIQIPFRSDQKDTIKIKISNLNLEKLPELLQQFLNNFEALKIQYIKCDSLIGYNQSISSSILLSQNEKENQESFHSGEIYFSVSQCPHSHELTFRFPRGRVDPLSLGNLAAKLKDFLEGNLPEGEELQHYIDFACWQHEQPLLELSDSLQKSTEETCVTFKSFCTKMLLLTHDEPQEDRSHLVSVPLMDFRGCPAHFLLRAFVWVLWETLGTQKVVVDVFSSAREELGLQEGIGMFEISEPRAFQTDNWNNEEIFSLREIYTPTQVFHRSPFTFRYYPVHKTSSVETVPFPVTSCVGLEYHLVEGESVPVLCIQSALMKKNFAEIFKERLVKALELLKENPSRPPEVLPAGNKEREEICKFSQMKNFSSEIKPLFLERVLKICLDHPARKALSFGQSCLSFAELDEWSDFVRDFLLEKGVAPQDRVAVILPRSEWIVVLIIAILKSRAIYTPIDPSYPAERKDLMIRESRPKLVIDSLDMILKKDPSKLKRNLSSEYSSSDVVYSIFTSGTEGVPNLVDVTHDNLTHLVDSLNERIYSSFGEAILKIAINGSFSFDTSVKQWIQLANGYQLFVLSDEVRLSPLDLVTALQEGQVDVIDSTPSHLETWIDYLNASKARKNPFTVLVGGEAISEKLWNHLARKEGVQFFNLYGPTECTVDSTIAKIGESIYPTIGFPLSGVAVAILTKNNALAKIGEDGEILIGGLGVSQGYPNNPGLSQRKFISLSIKPLEPDVWYRSGDLAAWNFGGEVVYKGRVDHQIKVRGHRIELSEVQKAILEDCNILQSYLTQNERGALIAFLRANLLDEKELRRRLEQKLPSYAVPAEFYIVKEEFPRNVHGKIDRGALYKMIQTKAPMQEINVICPKLKVILQIMQELLTKDLTPDMSFFASGGDSILGIQLVARAKREGIKIPILKLFTHQTARQLTSVSEGAPVHISEESSVPAYPFPLSPIQEAFLSRDCLNRNHWNQSRILHIPSSVGSTQLQSAFEKLCEIHPSLRLRLVLENENARQQFSLSHPLLFDVAELNIYGSIEKQIEEHSQSAQLSLDLENGPLLAVKVLKSQLPYHIVFIALHHFAVDGLSWNILLKNLDLLLSNQPPAKEKAYFSTWIEQLQQHRAPILSSDFKIASLVDQMTSGCIREMHFSFEKEASQFLLQPSLLNQYGIRIEEVILAALASALFKYSENKKIRIDHEVHGRDEEVAGIYDFSNTVGWFTNVNTLGIDSSLAKSGLDILTTVKEAVRSSKIKGMQNEGEKEISPQFSNILFNYFGEMTSACSFHTLMEVATQWTPFKDRSEEKTPRYEVEVDVHSIQGKIEVFLEYDNGKISGNRIDELKKDWLRNCSQIIEELTNYNGYLWTESDFPSIGLSCGHIRQVLDQESEVSDLWPLTSLQNEMLDELQEHAPWKYVFCVGFQIEMHVESTLLEKIWNGLFERFASLRTVFRNIEGKRIQLVKASSSINIRQENNGSLLEIIHEEKMKGFDRLHEPPFRACLISREDKKTDIIYTIDLTRIDLTSYFILFELAHSVLLKIETKDNDQRDWRPYILATHGKGIEDQKKFWKRQLLPHVHSAPYAHQLQNIKIPAYKELKFVLVSHETIPFRLYTRENGITLNILFLALWSLCEARVTENLNPIIGITLGGRSLSLDGIEKMVGRFVTTLPLHIAIEENFSLESWLKALQIAQSELMNREIITKKEIKKLVGIEPGKNLYQTNFVYENDSVDMSFYHKYRIAETPIYHSSPETPLRIEISPFKSENIEFRLGYISECIDLKEVQKYYREFSFILKNFSELSKHPVGHFLKAEVKI